MRATGKIDFPNTKPQLSHDGDSAIVIRLEAILYSAQYANPAEIWETMVKTGRDVLEKAAAITAKAGVKTDTRLIEINTLGRRIPEIIAEQANDWPADLIILGTHGRRGLSRVFLGSVAEGIVRVSTKPVLLIRGT